MDTTGWKRTPKERSAWVAASMAALGFLAASCTQSDLPATDEAARASQTVATTPISPPTTVATTVEETTTTTEPTDPLLVHVSPSGDDGAAGTERSPFASVEHALTIVEPGATLFLHEGTYDPIVVDAAEDLTIAAFADGAVVVEGRGYQGHGVLVTNSDGFGLEGITVKTALWGVWIESSTNVTVRSNTIEDLGQEGVMVKRNSSEILIENNTIRLTGQRPGETQGRPFANFGEAVYIGNAGPLDDGTQDQSNNVTVRGNEIYDTTAEAIDVKPWTHDILIENNLIYDVDTATSGAIVVGIGDVPTPASGIVIRRNVIHSVTRTSNFDDGNAIVISSPATVTENVIWNVQHYGILIDRRLTSSAGGEVIITNNLVTGSGLDGVAQLSESPNVTVTIEENVTGQTAQDVLGTAPTVADAWAAVASLSAP